MITMRGRLWLTVGVAVTVAVLAVAAAAWAATAFDGASTGAHRSTSDGSTAETPPTGGPAVPEAPGDAAAQRSERAPGDGRAAAPAPVPPVERVVPLPPTGRDLVRSAALILDVADLPRAAQGVRDAVARSGGLVADERFREGGATLAVQVPATNLDSVLADLSGLGVVAERSVAATDVTEQMVDLEGRLATQQASVARVRALLDRATTIGEIVQIESELTAREADLESIQRRLAALQNRVAMSTVRVELRGTAAVAQAGFLDGLAGGWRAFLTVGRGLLLALGAALPFLVVAGVGVVAVLVLRRRSRARRAAAGETG